MTPLPKAEPGLHEAHSLQLLTIYEQRIQRAADKNIARLETLQARRKEAAKQAMHDAKLLYQLAQAEGRPYQPEAYFSTAPIARESVFSTPEVARELNLDTRLHDAKIYNDSGELPKVKKALVAQVLACAYREGAKGPYGAASDPKPA